MDRYKDMDKNEKKSILKAYAKLEAKIKDEIDGLEDEADENEEDEISGSEEENEEDDNAESKKEHFWDFAYEIRHVLDDDLDMLEDYVEEEKEKRLDEKEMEEDDDDGIDTEMHPHTILQSIKDLAKDFNCDGEECFEICSTQKIKRLGGVVEASLQPEMAALLKAKYPKKLKFIRNLMLPYHETVRKIGDPSISTHEKRKLLQKAQVGKGILKSILDVLYPILAYVNNN